MLPHLCAWLLWLAPAAPAQSPVPAPSPSPAPSATPSPAPAVPQRLRLDIERHVESVMRDQGGTPRFETSLEVLGRPPDLALAEQLAGFDLECGPAGGPPTANESMEFRPHPAASLDLAALARALSGTLGNPGPPRYFLYRVHGSAEVEYMLREQELRTPPGQQPNTRFELLASFPDLASAVHGFRRMTRGFDTAERADQADPPSPWATTTCRLRPRRP
jgi:hypothetical protein